MAPTPTPALWQETLKELMAMARVSVLKPQFQGIAQRLLVSEGQVNRDINTILSLEAYTADLAVFTAPPGRTTAIERLARQFRPPAGSVQALGLEGLLKARFGLFEITGPARHGVLPACSLLSGKTIQVEDQFLADLPDLTGLSFAARLVPMAECLVVVGLVTPVDGAAQEALRPWMTRDGRGWTNAVRAAEALYRHALRHDCMAALEMLDDDDDDDEVSPEDGRLHELAFAIGERPRSERPGGAFTAEEEREVRGLGLDGDTVMDALEAANWARSKDREALATTYEQILVLMLDTLQRRAAIGQAEASGVLGWVESELASSMVPPQVRALYQRLKSRVMPAEDAGLDRLRGLIRGLRAKTVEQGCTEEEALAAAAKVADLLDRYGLSLSEVELRHQHCDGFGIDTGRKRESALDSIVPTIAVFCDCRSWRELQPDKLIRHVFFGLPADIAGARYLYDLIGATLELETNAFKSGELYREHHSGERANATRSFQAGMAHSIAGKLRTLKEERAAGIKSAHGRDLVPVKHALVDDELEKLGMNFTSKTKRTSRVLSSAYQAGRAAGELFEINRGLEKPEDLE